MMRLPFLAAPDVFCLWVGAEGAQLWHRDLAPEPIFADHPDRAAALAHLLLAKPACRVLVIADDPAQEIRLDLMPLLRGRDRRQLIARRVQQHFPAAAFATCLHGQKQATQERIALFHMPEDGANALWKHWLAALPNPAAGLIPSTRIAARLLEQLAGNERPEWLHGFFLTATGLRHVVLHAGRAVLTLQHPLPSPTGEQIGKIIQQAAQGARQYLARHGWREEQSEQIIGIVPPAVLETARQHLPPEALLLTPAEVGHWLRLPQAIPDMTTLFCFIGQQQQSALSPLLLPVERGFLQQQSYARMGWAVAATLLLTAGLMLGWHGWAYQQAQMDLVAAQAENHQIAQRMQQNRENMGDAALARARARQAQRLRQEQDAPTPWGLLTALGNTMPASLRLQELRWEVAAQGTRATLALRVLSLAGDKDTQQQNALRLYDDFNAQLQQALPTAQLKTLQTPYALAADQTFSDPHMLQTTASGEAQAQLEVLLP